MDLSEHLFRRESGRMVATLTRIFGVQNLALAEDVVQEAFCRAVDVWSFRGVPENPSAWLMATAKHCALDALRRERTARTFAPEVGRMLESEWTRAPAMEELFGAHKIKDDLLRMMFSCCHPGLPGEGQVALILNILCGFSAGEIAHALVSTPPAIEKRITRSKKVLARSGKLFEIAAPDQFTARIPAVHTALYLLFNEGYHGASPESAVRAELCREAMRLTAVLLENPLGARPDTYALAALMCLNAARLPGRLDPAGNLHALLDQDRSLWDQELMAEGLKFLELSAAGAELSEYHVEAAIASLHAMAPRMEDTDWAKIVSLYDTLIRMNPSPVVALNRAIAIAHRDGPERGLEAMQAIAAPDRLSAYPFYEAALAELHFRCGRYSVARQHFTAARSLARNRMERQFFDRRIEACERHGG